MEVCAVACFRLLVHACVSAKAGSIHTVTQLPLTTV